MTKIESVVKTALLNGKDFSTKRGWIIKISTDDKVQIWPPKGEGRETTLAFLDKAVKDFCKQADVMAPGVNETNAPKSTSDGSLGKDTSGKSPKKFNPSVNKTPKPDGSFTDKSLGSDTSMDEAFAIPSVNKDMTPDDEGLTDTDLGSDSSGNSTKFDNKVVNVQSDGRTGKRKKAQQKKTHAPEILANVGDVNFIDYGGLIVVDTGYGPEGWYIRPPDANPHLDYKDWELYQFPLDKVVDDSTWFMSKLKSIADTIGSTEEELRGWFASDDLTERALGYDAVIGWGGADEFDDPQQLDAKEIHELFGEEYVEDEPEDNGPVGEEVEEDEFGSWKKGKISDTFANGPDPSEIYRKLNAKSVSKSLLTNILNAEEWEATQRLAQMDKNQPKRGPGMPGAGKATYSEGNSSGNVAANDPANPDTDLEAGCHGSPKKKSLRTAGPKLREKWLNDGGYHREIESESAEELHALVQGFGGEDVDWAKFKPAMPEDKDAEAQQQPVQEGAGAAPITAKKGQSQNEGDNDLLRDVDVEGHRLQMWYAGQSGGRDHIHYKFSDPKGTVLFEGSDYSPSPMTAIDSDEAVRGLLGFLTLKPGDTDDGYFEKYTDEQKSFADSSAEGLSLWGMDPQDDDEDDYYHHFKDWEGGSKLAQSADVEAVDDSAKETINNYFGEYGKELTKDDGVAPKGKNPKKMLDKGKKGQAAPPPATPAAPAPAAPGGPGAAPAPGGQPAAPAPKAPAPKAPQGLQPGVGDAGIQALGWTAEDVQSMSDDQKKGILQIKLTKPGTQPKQQMPEKSPAPKTPAPGGPGTPPAGPQGPAAPGSEPAPPAPSAPAPKATKGGKKVKRGQAAPMPDTDAAPAAPAQEAPQSPAVPGKAPATPAAPKGPTKPAGGPAQDPGQAGGGQEQQAFQILQEVQQMQVNAATPNEVGTAKVSQLLQRLLTELGITPDQASKLFGLQRGNFGTLFK
jgi:hypothetical protein